MHVICTYVQLDQYFPIKYSIKVSNYVYVATQLANYSYIYVASYRVVKHCIKTVKLNIYVTLSIVAASYVACGVFKVSMSHL